MVFSKISIFSLWGKSYFEKIFRKKFFRKIFADLKNDAASEKIIKNRYKHIPEFPPGYQKIHIFRGSKTKVFPVCNGSRKVNKHILLLAIKKLGCSFSSFKICSVIVNLLSKSVTVRLNPLSLLFY